MVSEKNSHLFCTLQGLGNSIIQWPIIECLNSKTDLTLAVMNNGSSRFYREMGYRVIEIKSRKDILFKLALRKFDSVLTPCPSWRRECLASLITSSKSKTVNIHENIRYQHFLPAQSKLQADPSRHDIENTISSLKHLDVTVDLFLKARETLKARFYDETLSKEKYVVLHPTASTQFKFYPKSFWVELASTFSAQGYSIYILSGNKPLETQFCLEIIREIPQINYLKGADFPKLCTLIRNAQYFVGLDSAILHLAATFDTNLVALWSFADFRRIYPFSSNAKIYMPDEVFKAKSFKYPKKELTWLKRAKAQDIIKILRNEVTSAFNIDSSSLAPVGCYRY